MTGLPPAGLLVVLEDRAAETAVFLSPDGDHIVVRCSDQGEALTLPANTFAWDRAVRRAFIGSAFV